MSHRIVEISSPGYLHIDHRQLVVDHDREEKARIPVEDMGVLILSNPQICITQATLASLLDAGAVVVVCNQRHLPSGILAPLSAHTLHGRVANAQAVAPAQRKADIWQQLIRCKLERQSRLLAHRGESGVAAALKAMSLRVTPNDQENREAQAAQHYWRALMGKDFTRSQNSVTNRRLNYGYALIRAALARAIVGSGLHPAFGIKHHNQYDAFALADDLIEPLRPLVDERVSTMMPAEDSITELTPGEKRELLEILGENLHTSRKLPLLSSFQDYAASIRDSLSGNTISLAIPDWKSST